jgi:hypothetical protein
MNDKKMVLAKDTANAYIVYRFGITGKIEFEFPEKTKESWNSFRYSYYLRGGDKKNEGLDLNYVCFLNGQFKYIIYNCYASSDEKSTCGIKVIDTTKHKTTEIKGDIRSVKGSLTGFRDNGLLKIDDELPE